MSEHSAGIHSCGEHRSSQRQQGSSHYYRQNACDRAHRQAFHDQVPHDFFAACSEKPSRGHLFAPGHGQGNGKVDVVHHGEEQDDKAHLDKHGDKEIVTAADHVQYFVEIIVRHIYLIISDWHRHGLEILAVVV